MKSIVDLNCDMGEGFGHWSYGDAPDEDLMAVISSANVATGFHAGDPNTMDKIARLAGEHGVGLGAHPGFRDLQGFGRRVIKSGPEELVNDILYQIGALREFGRRHGVQLQHVKPHGALYMEAAVREDLSIGIVEAMMKTCSGAFLYCMGSSKTYEVARDSGLAVAREFYADREYDTSGSILFTRKVHKANPEEIAQKCLRACRDGVVRTVTGEDIPIEFESICFHSDTPGALQIGTRIRETLTEAGISIAPVATVLGTQNQY